MARPRKRQTTAEQIQQAEAIVLKRKTAYDEAVALLKELREKEKKENQEALLKAVASSKWSYEKIMESRAIRKKQTNRDKNSYSISL